MSERERWIVYPLIFFALGAALRDKFLQQVTTKEIHCERVVTDEILCREGIACREVQVFDPDRPERALAGLSSLAASAADGKGRPVRFGVLALNNQQFGSLTGNPPAAVRQALPLQAQPPRTSPAPTPPPQAGGPVAGSTPHVLVPSE